MSAPAPAASATLHQRRGSIAADGRRVKLRLADVKGFFTRRRLALSYLLIAVYALAPFLRVDGRPLILIDIIHRHLFLAGMTFNAQDAYLLFFLLAGALLSLILVTTLVGRVWCGWACPQTVFMESVFRRIERALEGPKAAQLRLAAAPWGPRKLGLAAVKHGLYLLASLGVAHIFISYFVSVENLRHWIFGDPREHWDAFLWMGGVTLLAYGNFAWFREQTCLIVCPYGRFQSAMTDDDSLVIGYDAARGEPRGRKGSPGAADCVDCRRCVEVCPTGIDIREGLQLECIACANCVDACDAVMASLGRERGLIRYDSLNGLAGRRGRILRPRVFVYAAFWLAFGLLAAGFVSMRRPFEAALIRQQGSPYVLEGGRYRNSYLLHLVNKTPRDSEFSISLILPQGAEALLPVPKIALKSLADARLPLDVLLPAGLWKGEFEVRAVTTDLSSGKLVESQLRFLGP